jgi:glycosyltransferase involved in cell wall biosynthesis
VTTASVIVCTRNRAALLTRCIASIAAQHRSGTGVEVVVVDNASADSTATVARRLQDEFDDLRYAYEPVVGLSRARNHGIRIATGEVLVFIDDDAVAQPGWLDAMLDAHRASEVAAVAGRVRLDSSAARPWWFVPEVEQLFSGLDLGDRPRLLEPREWPFGTNMSVRRSVAIDLGGFPEELGRAGGSLLSNEETAFFEHLRRRGLRIAYAPGAVVEHALPPDRLTIRYLARRAYAQGRSDARLHERLLADGGSWFDGRPSHALARVTLRGWRRCLVELRSPDERRGALAQQLATRSAALGFAVERSRRMNGCAR